MPSWRNGSATDLSIKFSEKFMTTKQIGNLTELRCLAGFVENGYNVSIPYGEDSKYDFIADVDGRLIKVQVKTSNLKKGTKNAICFSCRSTHKNFNGTSNVRYSSRDVDYFATYWDNQVYLVPINECSVEKTLRFQTWWNCLEKTIMKLGEVNIIAMNIPIMIFMDTREH